MSRLGLAFVTAALVLGTANAGVSQSATEPPLVQNVRDGFAAVERAARAARGGNPDAVQAHYEVARDLVEELEGAVPASSACRDLQRHALTYARARVLETEGFDRQRPAIEAAGLRKAAAARARLGRAIESCRRDRGAPGGGGTAPPAVSLVKPRTGEVSYGSLRIEARAPGGTDYAHVSVRGEAPVCPATGARRFEPSAAGRLRVELRLAPGSHDVMVRFCSAASKTIGLAVARDRWLLPAAARAAAGARPLDRALGRRLARVAAGFNGYSAVWYHDLSSGRVASWNAGARFPAASTVKLGVLVAALRALGRQAADSRFAYDLAAMTSWSSNLATNRLLRRIGRGSSADGSRIADSVLGELGAHSSTFTGEYRVGTSALRPRAEPPRVSARVTTARDLGRILHVIHAGAAGRTAALRALELDRSRAQLALSLLLDSEPQGENIGLVRGSVPRSLPIAQKHGWLLDARHSAAVVYPAAGPELVVLLTYRSGLSLVEANAYAADVLRVVLRPETRRP